MARETITLPTGKTITFLTGEDAEAAVLKVARECAAKGGKAWIDEAKEQV